MTEKVINNLSFLKNKEEFSENREGGKSWYSCFGLHTSLQPTEYNLRFLLHFTPSVVL